MSIATEQRKHLNLATAVVPARRRRRRWSIMLRDPGTALGVFLVASLLVLGLLAPWLPLPDPTEIKLPSSRPDADGDDGQLCCVTPALPWGCSW